MKLGLCIVGLGEWADVVLKQTHDMTDEFEFFYASRDLEKARTYVDRFGGGGIFGSYEDAARDPRVDAMYFLTPHDLHLEHARLAARGSKHILVEKPITRTMAEAEEMISIARDAGVRLMVAEQARFLSSVELCKRLMTQELIGDVRLIQLQREIYGEPDGWRTSVTRRGGGELIDGGIHSVDIVMNLGGLPEKVYAVLPPKVFGRVEGEDGAVVTARMPGGAIGLLNISVATAASQRQSWIAVTGSKGQLSFALGQPGITSDGSEVMLDTLEGKRSFPVEDREHEFRRMFREFRSSILEDREPTMSGHEGMKSLAFVLAAYQSAEQGAEVSLSPP